MGRYTTMSEAVLGALITAIASVLVQLLINYNNLRKKKVDDAVRDALLEKRLESIEHKLDIHNGYADKLGTIETNIAVISNEIKNLHTAR